MLNEAANRGVPPYLEAFACERLCNDLQMHVKMLATRKHTLQNISSVC